MIENVFTIWNYYLVPSLCYAKVELVMKEINQLLADIPDNNSHSVPSSHDKHLDSAADDDGDEKDDAFEESKEIKEEKKKNKLLFFTPKKDEERRKNKKFDITEYFFIS